MRVVSGGIAGKTETLTLHVEERFQAFDYVAAYSVSVVLRSWRSRPSSS